VRAHVARLCDKLEAHSKKMQKTATNVDLAPNNRMAIFALLRQMRKLRGGFLPRELFSDPAWDILLELKESELLSSRMTITAATTVEDIPATTGLRWLNALVRRRLVLREEDPFDGRRVYVRLHPDASKAIDDFLDTVLTIGDFQAVPLVPTLMRAPRGI
jgi:DNA-binding MarR family transcriptional regulator